MNCRCDCFPGGCSCGFQGKKAWNTAWFESSCSCNYWSLLGQVSCVISYFVVEASSWHIYSSFTNMALVICSEPWKRPSFSSIMESLNPLTKPSPIPQSGHGDVPLLTWIFTVSKCAHIWQFFPFFGHVWRIACRLYQVCLCGRILVGAYWHLNFIVYLLPFASAFLI